MECPRCQQENRPAQKFCGECGTPLHSAGAPAASLADLRAEIEHARRSLIEALEQQTATAEILKVISRSPTDIEPVLESVVESAARLCQAADVSIFRVEGARMRLVTHRGPLD